MRRYTFLGLFIVTFIKFLSASENIQQAQEAWSRRADGFKNGVVDDTQINLVIEALENELQSNPQNLQACTMLMEAIYFKGDFATRDKSTKKKLYDRGLQISEQALRYLTDNPEYKPMGPQKLVSKIKSDPQASAVCFWSSAMWGLWGDNYGAFQAARKGVAEKIRDYAEATILIDSKAFDGGGYRMLGRLHTLAPKVPFFTGWIKREKAISFLERAVKTSDLEPLNELYLAEALLKFENSRKLEAIKLLEQLIAKPISPDQIVEHTVAIEKAKKLLAGAH